MKRFAIPALAAAFALAACGEADAPAEGETTTEVTETTVVEPVATETAVVEGEEGSSLTIDGGDVDATVSEDGVQADVTVD